MNNKSLLAVAACFSFCTATAGVAATYTINGQHYDVSTITGSFDDNSTLLMSQVWWDDRKLAELFALTVGDALGLPVGNEIGPLFADSIIVKPLASGAAYRSNEGVIPWGEFKDAKLATYAVATAVQPVPLPAGGWLLLTGFGGVAALKRRRKRGGLA
ncbi:VPLPA-CTERM sorting domain-containing protein [Tateyamaria sp.]|uniref:VPLPA-CTERM sorting domain-containing protein n=1 Tax=Tateyamaria sp. TaxID=1929288 RepID=UPI00329C116C